MKKMFDLYVTTLKEMGLKVISEEPIDVLTTKLPYTSMENEEVFVAIHLSHNTLVFTSIDKSTNQEINNFIKDKNEALFYLCCIQEGLVI